MDTKYDDCKVLDSGIGPVFMDPDPDKARLFFKNKSKKMSVKLTPMEEAIRKNVNDGDYLVIGGFGSNRTPFHAVHEIVRQKRKHLKFAGHTSTHDMQVLAAGNTFDSIDIAYIIGLEARGLSKCSRKLFEDNLVSFNEDTNYGLAMRFKAASMGVPYIPTRNVMGTDTFHNGCGKIITCPFTGKKLVAKPAIYPDVAVLHVHEADKYGNARFRGITVSDIDVANCTKRLIITAERIIEHEEFRRNPDSTMIPYYLVDAVVSSPWGAYPGTMPYEYFSDEDHLREWLSAEKDPEVFKKFLDKNIYSCRNHFQYIEKNGGLEKMAHLHELETLTYKEESNG
jgi:glutaconate CoA-transferase subunit A